MFGVYSGADMDDTVNFNDRVQAKDCQFCQAILCNFSAFGRAEAVTISKVYSWSDIVPVNSIDTELGSSVRPSRRISDDMLMRW